MNSYVTVKWNIQMYMFKKNVYNEFYKLFLKAF